jgi:lipopolysaccharide/colanic/teichoic acid biosynthesis glycosyltransferase/ADP-glucose pyrophosphorylase
MKAVILASAETVKLKPMLEATSFATVPFGNKALIEHLLEQMGQAGVTQVIITDERPNGELEKLWEKRGNPPLPLRFTFGKDLPGSASSLKRLKSDLNSTFIVANLNQLVTVDLKAALQYHQQSKAVATAVAVKIPGPLAAAFKAAYQVAGTGNLTRSTENNSQEYIYQINPPEAYDSGIYILEPEVLDFIGNEPEFDLHDLMVQLTGRGRKVSSFLTEGQVHQIDTLSLYWQANMDMLDGKAGSRGGPAGTIEIKPGIWAGADTKIHPAAKLTAPLIIGNNCKIDQDVKLENSVIGDGVVLEQGAQIRNSVVFPQTKVGLAVKLNDSLVRGNLLCQGPNFEADWVSDLYSLDTVKKFSASHFFRRAFNFTGALFLLILISPILLVCAIAIKLDSPGPIMYRQLRVGEGRPGGRNLKSGRVFKIYKFRTMYTDADERLAELKKLNQYKDQAFFKMKNDPRITRVGKFLRKTSLDELPQLINVVLGDMQLVGNRPLPVYEAEALSEEWQKLRFNAPAGMTGLWQISGRSNTSAEERLILDNYYAITYSFWGDIKILLMTIPALIRDRGAH